MAGADDIDQVAGRQPGEADLDVAHRRLGYHDALGLAAVLPGVDEDVRSAHRDDRAVTRPILAQMRSAMLAAGPRPDADARGAPG